MAKQIQVTIPKPCNENWDIMTQEEQGRHCKVCAKIVLDFTLMTDGQILSAIQKAGNNACGRFTNDQLDRPLVKALEPKWYMAGMWKYMLSSFLLFKGVQVKSQVKEGVSLCAKPVRDTLPKLNPERTMGIIAFEPRVKQVEYTGTVSDISGSPIADASIMVIGKKGTVTTNNYGKFSVNALPNQEIQITAVGYEMQKLRLTKKDNNIILESYQKMGEVVVIAGGIRRRSVEDTPVDITKVNYTIKDMGTHSVVPNASVVMDVNGKITTLFADEKGNFQVKKIKESDKVNITVSSIGYKTKTVCINGANLEGGKLREEFFLEREVKKQEEVVVISSNNIVGKLVAYSYESVSDGHLKNDTIVNKKETVVEKEPVTKFIVKAFPNPIQANQQLQVQYNATVDEMIMLQLTTVEGKTLLMQKEKANKGLNSFTITIPSTIAAQTVVLQIMNSVGKYIATEKIVVQ